MLRNIILMLLICVNGVYVFGQKTGYSYRINKGTACAEVLQDFSNRYGVLVAYSPTLLHYSATENLSLHAEQIDHLFEKLCHVFQLDFIRDNEKSYLVRTEAGDVESSEFMIMHLRLIDGSSRTPIAYAAVYDKTRKYFGFTDEQGDCFIRLPKSKQGEALTVHSLSYDEMQVVITGPAQGSRTITMEPDPIKTLPVTINTYKKKLSLSVSQGMVVSNELVDKIALASPFQKDVMRTMQLMPGVSAINDSKSSIRIRGANEEATLLVLDKMPVYRADHFYGIFGAFNSWYVKNITLYKNNLPVEYGGRTSGMLKMDSGSFPKKFNLNIDLNLLSTGLMADVPISKNLAFKFSARTTYTDLLNTGFYDLSQRENLNFEENKPKPILNNIISRPDFDFYDANGRIFYRSGNHNLDLNVFRSQDRFSESYSKVFRTKLFEENKELFNQNSNWKNQTSGLNYTYTGRKGDFDASIYRTEYSARYQIKSNLVKTDHNVQERDTLSIQNDNLISDKGIRLAYSSKESQSFKVGWEYISHINQLNIENDRMSLFVIDKNETESSLFAQKTFGGTEGWMVEPGLRATYFGGTAKAYFLPQVYLRYYFNHSFFVKGSAGSQVQFVRLFDHENILGQNQQFFAMANKSNIPVGYGRNFMLGAWKTNDRFVIDLEIFYRTLDGALTHATQRPGLRRPPDIFQPVPFVLFSGDARAYGGDMAIAYEGKKVFSMVAYTLSKSENRFKGVFQNQYFPSQEDSRHQLKWINTFSAGSFDITANYIGASGRPYLDLSSIQTLADRSEINIQNYIRNLPAYHRLDLGVFLRFRLGGMDSRAGFSVYNLFDRINVKYRQFIFQLPPGPNQPEPSKTILGSDVAQLGRTFNISFNISIK